MQSSTSINLIKNRSNILDEIIKWALSVGRLLIIIVEVVAFSTFIYRFTLDRTLIDLHDKINQEQAIVGSLKEKESMYRNLQERIALASEITNNGNKNVDILNQIVVLKPAEISFDSYNLENKLITLNIEVSSINSLTTFIKSLRASNFVNTVSIESIISKNSGTVNVLIKINLK